MKIPYRYILSLGFALLLLTSWSCKKSAAEAEKPILLVSIEPQRKMLEELAEPYYSVVTLLPPGSNPETFEPTVAQRMRAAKSQAYFPIGYLPFEEALSATFEGKAPVVDTSAGIELLSDTHSHGDHDHAVADPHIWSSLRNGKIMAQNMAAALAQLDPEHAQEYRERSAQLSARLDSLDAVAAQAASGAQAFAVWHPSLSYFARDYGLKQIAVGQESKEVSLKELKRIIEEAREDSVKVFFFQREYDSRQADNLNQEIGSRLVVIDPLAYDWDTELIRIADELSR
ncbi:MAG: zinc ABC transporter substrate-binding protein [Bacteroidales bacterium]|nr:zinc ABC transporter substrate-binding protein [Bacteroidales bacterium]